MRTNNLNRNPIVIVGAGLAGLTAASLLTRNGLPVTIFEANEKVGGCCATTTLDGYTFHDGAVFLGIIPLLDHAFAKIGLNRSELLPLRKTLNSSTTLPDGTVVTLGGGNNLTVTGRTVDVDRYTWSDDANLESD